MSEANVRFRKPTRPMARGRLRSGRRHMIQVPCAFEPDVFEEIRAHAQRNNMSFAEAVRTLVDWGFEAEHD